MAKLPTDVIHLSEASNAEALSMDEPIVAVMNETFNYSLIFCDGRILHSKRMNDRHDRYLSYILCIY